MICYKSSHSNRSRALKGLVLCVIFLITAIPSNSQSSDQNYPTPITSNEVSGEIRARDIGDSRVTTYYYLFRGARGDVFINVVTNNLNGSIDLFTKTGLRPRTKITFFADSEPSETGRVVYMRESELLILRIQARTPSDEPGTFQLKFAGAFSPVAAVNEDESDPVVERDAEGAVRVNAVGTILPTPIPTPVKEESPAGPTRERRAEVAAKRPEVSPEERGEIAAGDEGNPETQNVEEKPETQDADNPVLPVKSNSDAAAGLPEKDMEEADAAKEITVDIGETTAKRSALVTISREPEPEAETTLEQRLASVLLRVTLKNGTLFARPMNEVLSVNVIRGILTIVTTDGKIEEFSILDVAKMTIE